MIRDSLVHEVVVVLDYGSQYSLLIARRIREMGVYCEILPCTAPVDRIRQKRPVALVLSGGPASVLAPGAPQIDPAVLRMNVPVLGICYGMQLLARVLGGDVRKGSGGEYGPAKVRLLKPDELFAGLEGELDVWMSHGDRVESLPSGFQVLGTTETCKAAAMGDPVRRIYGVQFHPEVAHTPSGGAILRNFLFRIAGCKGDWTMAGFVEESVGRIRERVGQAKVICALSGGVDSSVVAALVGRAVGRQMVAIFVNNGLLRHGEVDQVREVFTREYPVDLRVVDAEERFLAVLAGVSDPEEKRKAIGKTFIDVFTTEAGQIGGARFLAQGTLYPDVIESHSAFGGPSATIKSHHNVGGLPERLGFELIEPLRELFKDEVRELGRQLGLPDSLLKRQPFPGPGLSVRILGEVTREALAMLRQADLRVQEEIDKWPGKDGIWQSFAILLPVKTVGVMGDERTYANVVALRVVTSTDGMTADWAKLPYDLLGRISSRIINEVRGVNRVVYDLSSKPPATIEWE